PAAPGGGAAAVHPAHARGGVTATGGPLAGVRVAEFTHYIAGPHCAQILADHGADVVKVEPPGGEPSRRALPRHDGASVYFATHNRGKRILVVDLKRPAGAAVLRRLLEWADVVV